MMVPKPELSELFTSGMIELLEFYLKFSIFIVLGYCAGKIQNHKARAGVIACLIIIPCILVWNVSIKSEFAYAFSLAFLMMTEVYILHLIPFTPLNYALFFAVFMFPKRLFNSSGTFFGQSLFFSLVFVAVFVIAKLQMKKLKGNIFYCYLLFIVLCFTSYLYQILQNYAYLFIWHISQSSPLGVILSILIMTGIMFLLVYFIQWKFTEHFNRVNSLGRRYPAIERYFISISIAILLTFILIHIISFAVTRIPNQALERVIPLFCIVSLCVQALFIPLLYKTIYLKENLRFREWEKQSISSYYSDLQKNLSSMQNIGHDLKNIFFTMGNFVENSCDAEMKEFFRTKIYPFAADELRRNDLYAKLGQIPLEPLQSFFYLKISQALNCDIDVRLDLRLKSPNFEIGMEFMDLIRVFGILMDNAIEECMNLSDSRIEIRIVTKEGAASYTIKNTVTTQKRNAGIHEGISTKGNGRGKGLIIMNSILEQYPFITLNSYFSEDLFIQNLNILVEV